MKKKEKEEGKGKICKVFCLGCALSTCKLPAPPPPNFCLFTNRSSPAPQTTHCLFYWCTKAAAKPPLGRGPPDGFCNPQTPPPSRYFYLKSICCFQTEIGSRGKFTNRCLSKGANRTRTSPTLGTCRPRKNMTSIAGLPSPPRVAPHLIVP